MTTKKKPHNRNNPYKIFVLHSNPPVINFFPHLNCPKKASIEVSNDISNDTKSVIDTDTAGRGIAGIDYRVLGIPHH